VICRTEADVIAARAKPGRQQHHRRLLYSLEQPVPQENQENLAEVTAQEAADWRRIISSEQGPWKDESHPAAFAQEPAGVNNEVYPIVRSGTNRKPVADKALQLELLWHPVVAHVGWIPEDDIEPRAAKRRRIS
jgi:hypothetical protein